MHRLQYNNNGAFQYATIINANSDLPILQIEWTHRISTEHFTTQMENTHSFFFFFSLWNFFQEMPRHKANLHKFKIIMSCIFL